MIRSLPIGACVLALLAAASVADAGFGHRRQLDHHASHTPFHPSQTQVAVLARLRLLANDIIPARNLHAIALQRSDPQRRFAAECSFSDQPAFAVAVLERSRHLRGGVSDVREGCRA